MDAAPFKLGSDVATGDEDGGVASERLMAAGFDPVALEHGPRVSAAAMLGEVDRETSEAEGALAGKDILA